MRKSQSWTILIGLIFLSLLGTACGTTAPPPVEIGPDQIEVDPVLQAFYNHLGGRARLGPAISAPMHSGAATIQYVRAGRIVYDPTQPPTSLFRLDPIGLQMGKQEPPTAPPANPQLTYINGHTIAPDFIPLYEQLGEKIVGLPLSEIRYNLIRSRYEQYFENLGMYRLEGSAQVGLLDYGVWACGKDCEPSLDGPLNAAPDSGKIDPLPKDAIHPTFRSLAELLGEDFTGLPLQTAAIAHDGRWEQILERVVVVTDSQTVPGAVTVRPLSRLLNIQPEQPRPYSGDPNSFFLATSADATLGYEIPVQLWEYISQHGGTEIVGLPITHYSPLYGTLYHQCFTNVCIFYDASAPETARIQTEPLGYAYQSVFGGADQPAEALAQPTAALPTAILPSPELPTAIPLQPTAEQPAGAQPGVEQPPAAQPSLELPTAIPLQMATAEPTAALPTLDLPTAIPLQPTAVPPTAPPPTAIPPTLPPPVAPTPILPESIQHTITIQVWERFKVIETQAAQEIGVWLMDNGSPIIAAAVNLVVVNPDGSEGHYNFPATDGNGQATLMLPELKAANGTVFPYRVCYQASAATRVCVVDYFLIWNNP